MPEKEIYYLEEACRLISRRTNQSYTEIELFSDALQGRIAIGFYLKNKIYFLHIDDVNFFSPNGENQNTVKLVFASVTEDMAREYNYQMFLYQYKNIGETVVDTPQETPACFEDTNNPLIMEDVSKNSLFITKYELYRYIDTINTKSNEIEHNTSDISSEKKTRVTYWHEVVKEYYKKYLEEKQKHPNINTLLKLLYENNKIKSTTGKNKKITFDDGSSPLKSTISKKLSSLKKQKN